MLISSSAPETLDVVPGTISIPARKNLIEISRMLTQIASGLVFADDTPALIPLNDYVTEAVSQFASWFLQGEFTS